MLVWYSSAVVFREHFPCPLQGKQMYSGAKNEWQWPRNTDLGYPKFHVLNVVTVWGGFSSSRTKS